MVLIGILPGNGVHGPHSGEWCWSTSFRGLVLIDLIPGIVDLGSNPARGSPPKTAESGKRIAAKDGRVPGNGVATDIAVLHPAWVRTVFSVVQFRGFPSVPSVAFPQRFYHSKILGSESPRYHVRRKITVSQELF